MSRFGPCQSSRASAASTLPSSPLESSLTSRSHRPDYLRKQDLSMARVGFNLNLASRSRKTNPGHQSVQDRDRLVVAIVRAQNRAPLKDQSANCIESPVIMKSSPCTNPQNSRARQHTIAGDHVPMTKPLSMITRCHFFSQFCAALRVPYNDFKSSPIKSLALHLFYRRQLNRHLTGRFSLTLCPRNIQEQDFPSRRTTCPGFPHQRFGK